ncbi:hypothetical protein TNCV_2487841 [Trichonephila clavipes]|uniref:Uncharacterized protein n=1 Tax=Trichonephila clavipes TaxID=2585209 RepID=A0A8X6W094_TRICX|nr:hypothetical protein TNCV_2487841 [Trichonephila clavipes]
MRLECERRMSSVGNNRGNWRNSEVVRRPKNGRNDYRGNYENSRQGNQWFESRNTFKNNDRRFNDRRTGAEIHWSPTLKRRYHLYRKRHTENIFYKQVKKSSTQVITAQGAKCESIGVLELNIRIRDFEKPWLLHVLADLE